MIYRWVESIFFRIFAEQYFPSYMIQECFEKEFNNDAELSDPSKEICRSLLTMTIFAVSEYVLVIDMLNRLRTHPAQTKTSLTWFNDVKATQDFQTT